MKNITTTIYLITILLFSSSIEAQVFTEDFEAGIPNSWAIFDNGVGTSVSWQPNAWGTNNTAAYIMYDCSVTSDAEDWLVTPLITPTVTDNFLRFFQSDPDPGDFGSVMSVRISTNSQTNPADFTTIYTQGESALTPSFKSHQIDLSAYIDQPIYIAFVMTQNCGDRWIIDDVEVRSECNIDLSITATGNTLTATQVGATYEWISCSGAPITGENNQSITLTDEYQFVRVKITLDNGCTETSVCYSVAALSISDTSFSKEVTLYPNPTNGDFSIDLGNNYANTTVTITDILERVVKKVDYSNEQLLKLALDESAGNYFIIVQSEDRKAVMRLVKE